MITTSTEIPKISVIIPVNIKGNIGLALRQLKKADYPEKDIEVLVAYGHSPSRQRNEAVKKARGEILYFLDDDSQADSRAFKRTITAFRGKISSVDVPQQRGFAFFPNWISRLIIKTFFSKKIYQGEIGAVGGPNVWQSRQTLWQSLTGSVLESFFVHSLMAARYRPIGPVHRASEKELILCNLAVRRDIFNQVGGFKESLYPNEENELLNRIEKMGYQLVYHPGVLVNRPRKKTLISLFFAFVHYGRGRMEQIREEGVWYSLLALSPLLFMLYLLGLIYYHSWFVFIPLMLYLILALGSGWGHSQRHKKLYLVFFLPLLFFLSHLSYAIGLVYGLFSDLDSRRIRNRKEKLEVKKIKGFGQSWV